MAHICVQVEVEEKKLKDIIEKLEKARRDIQECYLALDEMGIVKIISCNETSSQEIVIDDRNFSKAVQKAIRDNDEEA